MVGCDLNLVHSHTYEVGEVIESNGSRSQCGELDHEKKKSLILDGGRPIAEIAQLCGFQDAGYFSTVFRRNMGVPPSMYGRNIPE